jgi:hypothetical protein
MRFIIPANFPVTEDIFWCSITIAMRLKLGVIFMILKIECLRNLLRESLIWTGVRWRGEPSYLMRRLVSFLIGGECYGGLPEALSMIDEGPSQVSLESPRIAKVEQ